MNEYTPGPWAVESSQDRIYIGRPKTNYPGAVYDIVATVEGGEGYREDFNVRARANARLIAKAPALLESLRAAEEVLRHAGYTDTIFLARIRDLIARAEGSTP